MIDVYSDMTNQMKIGIDRE